MAPRWWPLPFLLLALLVLAPATRGQPFEGTVIRVVDGDTIYVQLGDRVEKIRYIGVNTPEMHHPSKGEEPGGREAAETNRRLVGGKRELDVRTRDRYGRLLAYVWVDDVMVNAEEADLRLNDPGVSRRHAEVRQEKGDFVVVDLGSTNGVRVNDAPVTRHALKTGDRLEVGSTTLIFQRDES